MTRKRFYLVFALLVVVIAVAGGVALGGDAQREPAGLSTSAQARAALAPYMATLRRGRGGNDGVPSEVTDGPLASGDFADFDSARQVGHGDAWIIPAQHRSTPGVCLVARGFMACPSTAALLERGISISVAGRLGEPDHVFGMAVDGITQVHLVFDDGRDVELPVADNYFRYDGPLPDRLTWETPQGVRSMTVPHPGLPQ